MAMNNVVTMGQGSDAGICCGNNDGGDDVGNDGGNMTVVAMVAIMVTTDGDNEGEGDNLIQRRQSLRLEAYDCCFGLLTLVPRTKSITCREYFIAPACWRHPPFSPGSSFFSWELGQGLITMILLRDR